MAALDTFGDQTLKPYQENLLVQQLKSLTPAYTGIGELFAADLMELTQQVVHLRTCVKHR